MSEPRPPEMHEDEDLQALAASYRESAAADEGARAARRARLLAALPTPAAEVAPVADDQLALHPVPRWPWAMTLMGLLAVFAVLIWTLRADRDSAPPVDWRVAQSGVRTVPVDIPVDSASPAVAEAPRVELGVPEPARAKRPPIPALPPPGPKFAELKTEAPAVHAQAVPPPPAEAIAPAADRPAAAAPMLSAPAAARVAAAPAPKAFAEAARADARAGLALGGLSAQKSTPPLWRLAQSGELDAAKALLAQGGDLEAVDAEGRTALMWAVKRRDHKFIEWLLELKPDLAKRDRHGLSAADYAVQAGDADLATRLTPAP